MFRTRKRSLTVAVTAALLLAACGGAEEGGEATSEDALTVVGEDALVWDVEELEAEAGTVEFELVCENVNHNLVIEELDEEVAECAANETVTGSIELEEGEYTYVCTIPGHESTMRGTLTVS